MAITTTISGGYVTAEVRGSLEMEDLEPLFEALETARRQGPFVLLTDASDIKTAPRNVLSVFARRLEELPSLQGIWLGDAVVVSSPAVRFVLSTLLIIAPLPTEVKAFDRRLDAERWCAGLLRSAGLPVPASLSKTA
jgi:hypothetical protein